MLATFTTACYTPLHDPDGLHGEYDPGDPRPVAALPQHTLLQLVTRVLPEVSDFPRLLLLRQQQCRPQAREQRALVAAAEPVAACSAPQLRHGSRQERRTLLVVALQQRVLALGQLACAARPSSVV